MGWGPKGGHPQNGIVYIGCTHPCSQISEFQNFRISEFQNFRISEFCSTLFYIVLHCSTLQNFRISEFQILFYIVLHFKISTTIKMYTGLLLVHSPNIPYPVHRKHLIIDCTYPYNTQWQSDLYLNTCNITRLSYDLVAICMQESCQSVHIYNINFRL